MVLVFEMWTDRLLVLLASVLYVHARLESKCDPAGVPDKYRGRWFSLDGDGNYVYHEINGTAIAEADSLDFSNSATFKGNCYDFVILKTPQGEQETLQIMYTTIQKGNEECIKCFDFHYRTPNVLEYTAGACRTVHNPNGVSFKDYCNFGGRDNSTMFLKDYKTVDCQQTWWGIYHFTYQLKDIASVCDSPDSMIESCYDPGTPYIGNEIIDMNWGECPTIQGSLNKKFRYKCLGSWLTDSGNRYAVIRDQGNQEDKFAYVCLFTNEAQQLDHNRKRWGMSRTATCNTMQDMYSAHYTLVLTPTVPRSTVIVPRCRFPANFTGIWYTSAERDSTIMINATHIHFHTKLDQYNKRDDYYICQQHSDSRYLTTKVSLGLCEIDFICFDFLPRHQNIIRFRWSKPFSYNEKAMRDQRMEDYMDSKYRGACAWVAYNMHVEEVRWKYRTLLLYPPVPIECPIAGRYLFKQKGEEKFVTRYRGITEVPRMTVYCKQQDFETDFAICEDTKVIRVDRERCMTLDYHARPIGEYDIPDHELICVGYWMEDQLSYLITYEKDDSVSPFRCWVYQQKEFRLVQMSRSVRSACGFGQTATSWRIEEGASLYLELTENERMHDECPQRFDIGRNPMPKTALYFPNEESGPSTTLAPTDRPSIVLLAVSSLIVAVLYKTL